MITWQDRLGVFHAHHDGLHAIVTCLDGWNWCYLVVAGEGAVLRGLVNNSLTMADAQQAAEAAMLDIRRPAPATQASECHDCHRRDGGFSDLAWILSHPDRYGAPRDVVDGVRNLLYGAREGEVTLGYPPASERHGRRLNVRWCSPSVGEDRVTVWLSISPPA